MVGIMGRESNDPKLSPGAALVKLRWDKATEEDRKAQSARLAKARAQLTPEERSDIARKAGIASAAVRWGKRKAKAKKTAPVLDPDAAKVRRREIASAAATRRWAKVRAAEQTAETADEPEPSAGLDRRRKRKPRRGS
jgi:hypothetical protein